MRYSGFGTQLQKELQDWIDEGLVSREQAAAIGSRYAARTSAERMRSRAVQAVAVTGAIAAGLGVILFFAANWDAMARPVRVAVLLVALIGSYAAGWLLLESRPILGRALVLVGALAFGAGIFLVGQMYHVQAHDPLAFALWSAGVAPLAWALRSRALTTLTLLTLAGWIVYEAADTLDSSTEDMALLAIPIALMLYGVALYGAGTGVGAALAWASGPMRALGYALASAGTFVLTFGALHREVEGEGLAGTMERLIVVLAVVAVAGAAALLLARGRVAATWELLALLAAVALGLLTAFAPLAPVPAAVLFNLLLVALGLGAVAVGYAEDELWLATAGLSVVTVDVLARFLDLSWGLLSRSTAFLAAGLLLLGLAFALERTRARLASRMAVR